MLILEKEAFRHLLPVVKPSSVPPTFAGPIKVAVSVGLVALAELFAHAPDVAFIVHSPSFAEVFAGPPILTLFGFHHG